MKIILRMMVVVSLVYMSACATTNVRQHPQISNHLKGIDTVVIAPPAVSIEQHNFDGETERLKELEDTIRTDLIRLADERLVNNGFKVINFDFNEALSQDEEFAYVINQVRDGYKVARKALYLDDNDIQEETDKADNAEAKQKEIDFYHATVGTAINAVAEKTGADSLLLINYTGAKKSGGNMAADVAMSVVIGLLTGYAPVANNQSSHIEVALIDSSNGNVLWTNLQSGGHVSAQIVNSAMHELPKDID